MLGVVPKTYLPGYEEYYEERWFSSAREAREAEVRLAGEIVPFGTDLLFQVPDEPGVTLAVEICEDLWAPVPPSSFHAVAGATVLLNPSASPDLVAKAEYRRELVRQQSGRTLAGLRLRQRRRPRVHHRPRLRRPPHGGGERRPPRRGRALPSRGRSHRDRRGHRAAARRAGAPDLVRRRGPRRRVATTGWCPSSPSRRRRPTGSCAPSTRTPSSPPTPPPSTSAAARSSRSRPPAWPAASSTSGRSGWCWASPAGSTRPSRCSCA